MYVKTNHRNLVRDMTNGSILNTDIDAALEYKRSRDRVLKREREIDQLKSEISELTMLVRELKQLISSKG